jgi:transposase
MYNLQLRICINNAYLERKNNNFLIKQLLYIFRISNGTLYNIINEFRKGVHSVINKKNNKKYTKSYLPLFVQKYIYMYVKKNKQFNINYLLRNIKRNYNISTSKSTIYRIIKLYGMTYKKVSIKKIYNAKNKKKYMTKEQLFKLVNQYSLNDILFIDETSIVLNNVPSYGWSGKGEKCEIKQPVVTKRYTLLMGMRSNSPQSSIVYQQLKYIIQSQMIQ